MRLPRLGAFVFAALSLLEAASAVDLKNRSTSASGQFIIYCDDRDLRGRVVLFVEETKERALKLMHAQDGWRLPIIMTMEPAVPGQTEPGVKLTLVQNPAGGKVELNVRIGDDPASIYLQKHILRAILIELAYRARPVVNGKPIVEAPWWAIEGIIQSFRRRDGELNSDVFKSISDRSKLPPLEKFLTQPPILLNGISGEVDRACAMCLVEALLGLPNGPENLTRFIRDWPASSNDAMGALAQHFPALADSEKSLAKWWSLQLARFADSERWQGLSLEDSDKELTTILSLQITVDKKGRTEPFALADFEKYLSLPGAQQTLRATQIRLVAFSARANPFFRPVSVDYEQIVSSLIAGKTKDIAPKITATEAYRKKLTERMMLITDYLNWFEATQVTGRNDVFDGYLRAVKETTPKPPRPEDPRITDYLDTLEKEFAPVLPTPADPAKGAVMR